MQMTDRITQGRKKIRCPKCNKELPRRVPKKCECGHVFREFTSDGRYVPGNKAYECSAGHIGCGRVTRLEGV